jgi:hypothetical protein
MTETPPITPDALVFRAGLRLIRSTPGATTLDDVARIRDQNVVGLLAQEAGVSAAQVREAVERNLADYVSDPETP